MSHLIDLFAQPVEPFFAPVPEAREVYVYTLQNDVMLRMRVVNPRPGWHWIEQRSPGTARITQGGSQGAHLVFSYLERLKSMTVIALFPSGESRWAVWPFNESDATQRGWQGDIMYCHLVRHRFLSGSAIVARSMAGTLLYDRVYRLMPDLNDKTAAIVDGYRREVARKEREERRKKGLVELTPQEQLETAGATMISLLDGVVTWSHRGHRYSMVVQTDGTVLSAGVCLAGTDSDHNLLSIVGVMEEHRRQRRRG